jgi:predicted Rossmann fold flavoprotein
MGVDLKREDTGKLFPVTDRARTVLQALMTRGRELGVEIRTSHRVSAVVPLPFSDSTPAFMVHHTRGALHAERVILATGGRSLPKTGSDGQGWTMVRRLGHTVTATSPALVPLVLDRNMFHAELSGLSQEVELRTQVDGRTVDRRRGSLLWTHFGISGPVVLEASRFWTMAQDTGKPVELRCNFLPDFNETVCDRWLAECIAESPARSVAKLLAATVPDRFAAALCRYLGVEPSVQAGQLTKAQRHALTQGVTRFLLPVERDRGWNYAEATAGGVPLKEINFRTMESKKVPGLYLIGEMLDCDGRIGGFNFQWAWATGYLAGRAVIASCMSEAHFIHARGSR